MSSPPDRPSNAKSRKLIPNVDDSLMDIETRSPMPSRRQSSGYMAHLSHLSAEESREVALVEASFKREHRAWLQAFQQYPEEERNRLVVGLLYRCWPDQIETLNKHLGALLKRDFVQLLPEELVIYLLGFLDPKSLCECARINRTWRRYADENSLWKLMYERHMSDRLSGTPVKLPCVSSEPMSWKKAFMKRMRIESNWRHGRCTVQSLSGHEENVITSLYFDDEKIVSGSDDNTLKVWSLKTGRCLHTLEGHRGGVWSCHVEGNTIVSGSTDRTVKIWDASTGECRSTLEGHGSTVRCLHLVGDVLVSGSRDMTLRVWCMKTMTTLHVLRGHNAAVRCVQFDGKKIASGSYDHTLRVWDVVTGACLHVLCGHSQKIYSMQFDGRIIVSGSLDTTIRVWDVTTGQCLQTLTGHTSLVGLMQLRGNILVSGNADKTLRVWDVRTGECLQIMVGHENAVTCLQFDNQWVVSGSMDGTLRLWDIKTGRLIRELLHNGDSGVVWRVQYTDSKIVCAVRAVNSNEARLQILDFDDERYEMSERDRLERQDDHLTANGFFPA